MPVVQPDNNFLLAIDKQTNESTVSATADYSLAVYSSTFGPTYDERRVEVTDASSIQGDVSKGLTHWEGEAEHPAYGDSLGAILQAGWPTDTKTGVGPYVHTYSGLGGTQSWIAVYREWPASSFEETFGKGLLSGFSIKGTADETPMRVKWSALGQTPAVANYSATLADNLLDGYFTLQAASTTIEVDFDTPNVNPSSAVTNVQDVEIGYTRTASIVPTADGVTASNISLGKVQPYGSATLIFADFDAYRASYYGAVAGTAASATIVTGAMEINCKHSVNATWALAIYVPAVQFRVPNVTPSPAGGPLLVPVTLNIQKPASGDHIQPVLTNSTSTAY